MRKNWRNNIALWLIIVLMIASCRQHQADHHDTYTCPMHPTVISDKPGTCPVCGMELVRKGNTADTTRITRDLAQRIISPNESVIASVKTVKGQFTTQSVTLEVPGVIAYDTRYAYTIPAKTGGRIEKVYLKYAFQPVKKGQKVAEIYSPELATAARELLYLVGNDTDNQNLIEASKNRLNLLGIDRTQIEKIVQSKEVPATFPVFSEHNGYVVKEARQASGAIAKSSPGMNNMQRAGASQSATKADSELLRAGDYVTTGQVLFKVVSGAALRVELDLPAALASAVSQHDTVTLDLGNGQVRQGSIDLIQPFFSADEEFVKVRVYLENRQDLRVGQLVNATLHFNTPETLWLPREAVLYLGGDRIVFVKKDSRFISKKVTTGIQANGKIAVTQGLASADEVASNAQYMVDSESFIKDQQQAHNTAHQAQPDSASHTNAITLTENQVRLANITTQKVEISPVGPSVVVNGRLATNEETDQVISSRATGRIEKLFIKESGRPVMKGTPLYSIYSEQLLTLQREFLLAKDQYRELGKEQPRYEAFLKAAERKLLLYGLTRTQIDRLAASGAMQNTIIFTASASGIVTEINVAEGQYVSEGAMLYRVTNTNQLWVEAELYPDETGWIKQGDHVTVRVSGYEHQPLDAKVTFLNPTYRTGTQVTLVRAEVTNNDLRFKPGMQAQVSFTRPSHRGLALPVDAVIRDASGAYVYVEIGTNSFQARFVKTGLEDAEHIEVTAGLQADEVVAVSGAYLLHSELILKHGIDVPTAPAHHH